VTAKKAKKLTRHPEDEIVLAMTEAEWDSMRLTLYSAFHIVRNTPKGKPVADGIERLLSVKPEVLTLSWLDKKRAEFP